MPNDSTMKFKADISQLKAAMQEASRAIKVANSEFKASTAGMDKWSSSATGLQAKLKQLNTVLDAQKKQLSLAEQELKKTVAVYGENSAETDRARIKVNNYQAAVNKTEKELNNYEKELKDVETGSKDAGKAVEDSGKAAKNASDGFTVMKGALASLVASGIRLAINGVVKLGHEIYDLGKQSIESYAQYEQLVGGVETLFGTGGMSIDEYAKKVGKTTKEVEKEYKNLMSAQDEVLKNAAGAYKTAGMSANEYMDTVTSFSASLIQGLDGDTAKAAKVADQAIIDMSDNANKMGTDISMIQNAYQGFAKDNYTMLDNLKLGYGGTQSEMARLVNNSGVMGKSFKATAENVKDIPFDKLIEAIHVTQEEMGITGTTAKEASETIEGSINAMKGSWQNLLTGLADETADVDKLWNDFIDSAGTVAENLLPRIKTLFNNVTKFIGEKLQENFPELKATLDGTGSTIKSIVNYVIQNSGTVLNILKVIGVTLAGIFVVNKVSNFITSITNLTAVFTKLKAATDATTASSKALALAQKAIPLVALVSGIIAVVTAMTKWQNSHDEAIRKTQSLTAEQKKLVEETKAETQAYNEADKARKEANNGISSEYGYIEQLKNEYNGLIGKNGEVKDKYKDRANFIVGELANALGLERDEIQKLINKNGKLGESIDKLIEKKKAEAMLSANEDAYKEAISKQGEALKKYQDNLSELEVAAKKRTEASKAVNNAYEAYLAAPVEMKNDARDAWNDAKTAYDEANKNYKKLEKSAKDAENTYVGYQATIQNYEGLSTAIINGDSKKIASALTNLQNNFITAKNGTKATLQQQVKDYQANYESLKKAIESGMPGVTQAQVKAAKDMVDKAKKELGKLPGEAKKSGKKAGEEHAKGVESTSGKNKSAGNKAGKAATTGEKEGGKNSKKTGKKQGEDHAKGVEGTKSKNKKAGEQVGKAGVQGEKDGSKGSGKAGSKAGDDYADSLGDKKDKAGRKAEAVGKHAKSELEVDTTSSGENFLQGFIDSLAIGNPIVNTLMNAVTGIGSKILSWFNNSLGEKSPSKLTFKSGKYFVQGFVNGVAKSQKTLVKTVQNLAGVAVKEMAKMSGFNFSEVASNASTKFADGMAKQVDYMLAKMNYKNEQKIKEFDSKISSLESKRDKKVSALEKARDKKVTALEKKKDKAKKDKDKKAIQKEIDKVKKNYNKQISATKSQYNKLIKTQEKYKEAYSTASAQMISDFQNALSEYQAKAQALIDDVINGITDKYNQRYDELISKQDSLIEKLKSSVELFEISGAGVITIGDIKEQTKQINDYYNKLAEIKGKVSADLFDQITSYDMDEGSAFISQLLDMSAADLKAYDEAYTQMLKAANKAGTNIYKDDFEQLEKDYQKELDKAFKGIDKQLKKLGEQAMKGFVNGLTKNTDYMNKNVKTFVKSLIARFKKELGIKSPSKVMAEIGEYTGEGFDNGLLSVVKNIQKTAGEIASAVSSPLNGITADIGGIRSSVVQGGANGIYGNNSNVVNNYNLVQNNTSPKALTALETYKARRRQINMMKAATQNS